MVLLDESLLIGKLQVVQVALLANFEKDRMNFAMARGPPAMDELGWLEVCASRAPLGLRGALPMSFAFRGV